MAKDIHTTKQLTNIIKGLTMPNLSAALKLIEQNKKAIKPEAIEVIKNNHGFFDTKKDSSNCWGTTLYTIGAMKELKFIDEPMIDTWLINNTKRIARSNGLKKRQFGDILVIRRYKEFGCIDHTALYLGDNLYWHQCGWGGKFVIEEFEDVRSYNGPVFYHVRPVKDKRTWKKVG